MPLATVEEVAALEGLALTLATSEPLKSGQPAFVGTNGTLYLSSAAAGANRAIIDGLARADAIVGASSSLEDRALTLPDWTAVIGATSLVPGTRYYLGTTAGKLAAVAPSGAGQAVIRVGVALSAQMLKIKIVDLTGIGAPVAPALQALILSTLNGTAGQSFSATISGATSGSTLAASAADGTALTIANGTLSGTFASSGQKQVSITETLAGATGSPKTTTLTLTIAATTPVLQTLGLSGTTAVMGTPFSAAVTNQTSGSTVAASSSDGTALTVSNGQVSGTFSAAGTPTITLTETLAGATGSPKSTSLPITVSASGPDLTNPANTELLHNL